MCLSYSTQFQYSVNNHSLINQDRFCLVTNSLGGGKLEFNLKEIEQQLYQTVVDRLCSRYNAAHCKLILQSETGSLPFDDFVTCHEIPYEKECLRQLIEYQNYFTHSWYKVYPQSQRK